MDQKPSCLLPNSVVPRHYALRLTPDLEKFTFLGEVGIGITIKEKINEITLHAADLEINDPKDVRILTAQPEARLMHPSFVTFDAKNETVTLVFPEPLSVGKGRLDITYRGILNDKMVGFYRSTYTATDGSTRHLATTQFEATDARRAFPCWDEPARKAVFDITLIVPDHLTALSNMPVREVHALESGLKQVVFDQSPVMSTYLVAFIVGELEYIQTCTNNGTQVRVYALPGKSSSGQFALETAKRTLMFYNEYYGIPYPLPKLDMVAIPDFAAGAMENWGLVTYRENLLLFDDANSSTATHQRVAEVVAHELAHQWFGNLVTMQWWTHLWLNEGFATWMASLAMDHLFPEWDIWTQFVSEECAQALALDGLRSSHPIEVDVGHPNEISQIFDSISYSKGASVIRMIHDFIGPDNFRVGLSRYLREYAYGNTVTEDLWNALGEVSGMPVQGIMDTWTKQPGYPLITLTASDWIQFTVNQRRFLASGESLTEEEHMQRWEIPLAYRTHTNEKPDGFGKKVCASNGIISLRPGSEACHPKPEEGAFFKLNADQIALVRVNYHSDQWTALIEAIRNEQLPVLDRYGLVSDALALTRAGHLSSTMLLTLLRSYRRETNYTVWNAVLTALGALEIILEGTAEEQPFGKYIENLVRPIATTLGWEEKPYEPHTQRLLRGQVIGVFGAYNDDAFTMAGTLLNLHLAGDQPINPNLRGAVYGIVAKNGTPHLYHRLIEQYEKEKLQEEKVRLLRSLGQFTDLTILQEALSYGFTSGKVRPGDFVSLLAGMTSHNNGRNTAWKFLMANWDAVCEKYASGGLKMLAHVISYTCNRFTRITQANEIEQFFTEHPAPSATRAIAETLELIRIRANWYARDREKIAHFLKS